MRENISIEELKEQVSYNPDTGEFKLLKKSKGKGYNRKSYDDICIKHPQGYLQVNILKNKYLAHRLAWFMYYEEWPECFIDHKDKDKKNNRINNLRKATVAENGQNQDLINSRNKTGIAGVYYLPNNSKLYPYQARITISKRLISLGSYKTKEEAGLAYIKGKQELHPFFSLPS